MAANAYATERNINYSAVILQHYKDVMGQSTEMSPLASMLFGHSLILVF